MEKKTINPSSERAAGGGGGDIGDCNGLELQYLFIWGHSLGLAAVTIQTQQRGGT